MYRVKKIQVIWIWIWLLALSLVLQAAPVQASTSKNQEPASKVAWDAYYYGDLPDEQLPHDWKPFTAIDSDHKDSQASRDLWLKASLPDSRSSSDQLLVNYYMVKNYKISLYVDGRLVFNSEKLLPSGFISWRLISYEYKDQGQVLLARLTPHQNIEKGFEVWSGAPSSLAVKLLRTEAPMRAGAIILMVFCVVSFILYIFNRSQALFIYFAVFFATLAIDLSVLGGGWQFAFSEKDLMTWGSVIHFNWYMGHASGILITHAIISPKGSKWIRNLGYAFMIYAIAAMAGWLLLGEHAQLLFYQIFYGYISTLLLLIMTIILFRALRRRKDAEIRIFAAGNVCFVGGLVLDRAVSGQIWVVPSKEILLTSHHGVAQISWSVAGFAGMVICLGVIMSIRLMHLIQLRSTNKELKKVNGELQIANEKLSHIDDIRSNMYSEVSHELNTPITAIKGYVQLMLNGTIPAGETRYLQVIHDKSVVMERMIDDMLEIAKLENKHIQFEYELLPFSAFYARLCAKIQLDMLAQGFIFKWSSPLEPLLPEQYAAIYADPMRVEQVFINLLSNARKFTPAGGVIQADAAIQRLGATLHSVIIRISDTGCGIELEDQEHIFERYYRGKSAKTGSIAGTGLGLPICREIMLAHHGEIGLEHSSINGSTFYISFPLQFANMQELESEETA